MTEVIIQIALGLFLIIIGILNTKGKVSMLHSYHTKRVKEEDIVPFGKKIGAGTMIVGCTIILAAICELLLSQSYPNITNIILIAGFTPGFILIFYALFKYNKGIF
jgi:hypothetical protein